MGQSQTREELRNSIQNELGAYFISALPPDSASQDTTTASSCTALIEQAQLEKWLSPSGRAGPSTAGTSDDTSANSCVDDLAHLWTRVDGQETTQSAEEGSSSNSASPEPESEAMEFKPSEVPSKLHGLMVGAIQLDMARPVVVHVVKKISGDSFTFQPPSSPQPSDSSASQEPLSARGTQNWTPGETPRLVAQTRPQSASTPQDDRLPEANDVTVTDYLAELEKDFGKMANKDEQCRFFSIDRPVSSDPSSDLEVNEASIVNQWWEKTHVAILSEYEIATMNESHAKAKQQHPSSSDSAYASDIKSPRKMMDESELREKVQSGAFLIPPHDPSGPSSSSGKKTSTTKLRGVVNLEKSLASEVRVLAQPHPNLVLPLKIVEGPNHLFLLFPYHRYSLETIFRFSPGVMDNESKKMFVAYQLLRTLQWLHDSDMVHGDLRPHNLKLTARLWLMLSGASFAPGGVQSDFSDLAPTQPSSRRNSLKSGDVVLPFPFRTNSAILNRGASGGIAISEGKIPIHQSIPLTIDRTTTTADWVEGRISNFEYLMKLNEWAGRRTGDPNFHPVMPWVIDFSTPTAWRDLTKSKFRLNKGDEQLDFTYANPIPMSMAQGGKTRLDLKTSYGPRSELTSAPYHINDTLTELTYYNYFARRTPLCLLRKYVRTNFVAAEYPASMERLYQWSPDECIPEFYADPSIFQSLNPGLADLAVPPWAGGIAKFLTLHREALESDQVSRFLHHWIDLTFGHKLSGEAGKQAKNVALMDRNSHRNHGFVQLFVIPHPARRRAATNPSTVGTTKPAITWTIPARETATNGPTMGEPFVPVPQVLNAPSTLIGSASGITSSFTSLMAPGADSYASQSSARDRRKSTRPSSVYSTSPNPPTTTNTYGPSIFSQLPKITIIKPIPAQNQTDQSKNGNSAIASSIGTQATPSSANTTYTSPETQDPATYTHTPHHSGDIVETLDSTKPSLQRHASLDSTPLSVHIQAVRSSSGENLPHALQRSSSDLSGSEIHGTSHHTPAKSHSEVDLTSPSSQASSTPHRHEEGISQQGIRQNSPIARVLETDLTLSLHREHYGSGSSFSDENDGGSSSNAMFRFSGEHPSPTPNISSPSTSPLGDDLETYQSQEHYTSAAIQSISSPTSSNLLLEPTNFSSPKAKPLSLSTGVAMASSTSESPTRQNTPTRTSLGPIPTTTAAAPPQSSSGARSGASSGSPKDRSEKEKEKTSFRKEFMKIFGSISDAVSSDKKPSEKSKDHHYGSPHGVHSHIATSPTGTPPPLSSHVAYTDSHGKQDSKRAKNVPFSQSDVSTPSTASQSLNASSNTIPYGSDTYFPGSGAATNPSETSLHDSSSNFEDPSGSLRLMGSVPSDTDSPLLTTTVNVNQTARAPPKMVNTYVEDLTTGEYQSRFLLQVSLLEPIFTAPFADFDLVSSDESPMSVSERNELLLDRAKCSDLFSAGCIIYQLLTGCALFHRDNIVQYLQGDGTWWWGSASQSIPRRFKALIFELVLAGRPYFLYALQTGVSLGYITRAMTGAQSAEQDGKDGKEKIEDAFDFGVASVAPSTTPLSFLASNTSLNSQTTSKGGQPANNLPMIATNDLGHFSDGILARFLNDDLISAPTSMKVFPSYFEPVYQFLARYHSTQSRKKRVKLALENIGFLVNLPMSGLELILPDLLSFFDHPDTAIDALRLIEPLAIKLGRVITISKLLAPILNLYERMQLYQQQSMPSNPSSTNGTPTSTTKGAMTGNEKLAANRHLELALELLAPRFVHTLLSKFGHSCFLKHIVGFLVNEIRSTRKEIGFAAGAALLRLVSVLSPPIYIRYILYPLLSQLNKANPEVLNAVLVEIGARMGEDVIVRHHMEVIVSLLQMHIFNKDAISVRIATFLLKLIASLVELIHPTKIVSALMVDHRCLFAILLTPPMHDKGLWDALLDCLSAVGSSMGLHLAIKYARPYIQQFFTLFGLPTASSPILAHGTGNSDNSSAHEVDPKSLYPAMVMTRFKDLLDVRSGGGNVSIQHALGAAMRIESYLMGPVASAAPVPPTIATSSDDEPTHPSVPSHSVIPSLPHATASGNANSTQSSTTGSLATQVPSPRHATLEKSPSQQTVADSSTTEVTGAGTASGSVKSLQVPSVGDGGSDAAPSSTMIAPRRLSSPVRPLSPTLSALATPPVETKEISLPPTVLRLATANEDGHVADHMPLWLASMHGMPYTPAPSPNSGIASSRPTSTLLSPAAISMGANGLTGSGSASASLGAPAAQTTSLSSTEKSTSGAKKPIASLSGAVPVSGGGGSSAWEASRDYEMASAPAVLHSFGPVNSTHSASAASSALGSGMGSSTSMSTSMSSGASSGSGWPPTLGPQQVWNFSGQVGHTFKEHSNAIRCVYVHDNERLFLTGSKDTTVKCWDMLSEGASRQTYTGHRLAVTHAEFVDRGNLVASCDGSVHVWELERGNRLATMEAASVSAYASNSTRDRESPSAIFTCFTSHQDGRVVVCGTSLATVTFTDLRAEQEVVCEWYLPTNATSGSSSSSQSAAGSAGGSAGTTMGASPSTYPRSISLGHLDQNLMVVGQSSGHVALIDIRSGLLLHNWRAHDAPIISLKSVPDAPGYLVSASLDKTIALWDVANANTSSPTALTHFKGHSDPHISFDIFRGTLYSIAGQKISIAPLFSQPTVIALEKRKLIKTNALKLTNQLTTFNILPSQHLALVGSDDGTVKVLQ